MPRINYGINNKKPIHRIHALERAASADMYYSAARHDPNPKVRSYSLQQLHIINKSGSSQRYESTIIDACTDDTTCT